MTTGTGDDGVGEGEDRAGDGDDGMEGRAGTEGREGVEGRAVAGKELGRAWLIEHSVPLTGHKHACPS